MTADGLRSVLPIQLFLTDIMGSQYSGEGRPPLVARWGGIPLAYRMATILHDALLQIGGPRAELEKRLLADTCELCGSHEHIEVHHVRALKDLHRKGRAEKPYWMRIMAARRRKTLVLCQTCHEATHAGRPPRTAAAQD